jgi:DNA-directed RNA polymerase subunit alpha
MGVVLRSFEMPKGVVLDEASATETYSKFVVEPFERGFGVTVGNSLRRVLLSSLEGAAISTIRIEGADHEFATLPGVMEDLSEIILNVKQVVLRSHTRASKTLTINVSKKGSITARDIVTDDTIEIVNPDQHIATLTKNVDFKAEFSVVRGRGFVLADQNKHADQSIGTIPVDSIFSPVLRVAYHVEETRIGQITDYDRLILEIWTNGSISPKDALLYGANILQQHVSVFANMGQLPDGESEFMSAADGSEDAFYKKLTQPVSEMELSVRSANCLSEARIKTIGELVGRSEAEMLKYRNFGKKSLNEISDILKTMGLHFGMQIDPKKFKTLVGQAS